MNQELWPQQIWQCLNSECGLRFPARKDEPRATSCPLCDSKTAFVEEFQRPPALRHTAAALPEHSVASQGLTFVLDNIRSANNVGSIFRTADAVGASIVLGGFTATPDNPKVTKTALGADESVVWSSNRNALDGVLELQKSGTTVWALEITPQSRDLTTMELPNGPLAVVVGNEVSGVDPGILGAADAHVHLPMVGIKTSLNVAVAMGAAAYIIGSS